MLTITNDSSNVNATISFGAFKTASITVATQPCKFVPAVKYGTVKNVALASCLLANFCLPNSQLSFHWRLAKILCIIETRTKLTAKFIGSSSCLRCTINLFGKFNVVQIILPYMTWFDNSIITSYKC